MSEQKTAYLKYIAALLLFGSNGIVASRIDLSSYEIVLLRTLIGSLLLIAIFCAGRNKFRFPRHKRQLAALVVSGAAMGASWMFLYEGYQQTGVSVASLAYYCGPVIVMALSPLLFREKLTATKVVGFLAVLAGVFLVNGRVLLADGNGWGVFCGAMSAVMYALMVIANKKARDITGLENALLQLVIGFLTVAAFVGLKQGFVLHIAAEDWGPILLLGLVNTGVGCYLYFSAIGRLPVQTVAICGYLEPLSAVLLSVLLLHEVMLPWQIVGAALILGGAIFAEWRGSRRPQSRPHLPAAHEEQQKLL